jgi:hypothetical protein
LPYPSRDILEHQQVYHNIVEAFEELFQWIDEVVRDSSGCTVAYNSYGLLAS